MRAVTADDGVVGEGDWLRPMPMPMPMPMPEPEPERMPVRLR